MKENIEKAPNGFLVWWELLLGYLLMILLVALAYLTLLRTGNSAIAIFAIVLTTTLQIVLIVFRKRPISANFKVGLNSGIDLRWNLKKDEETIV